MVVMDAMADLAVVSARGAKSSKTGEKVMINSTMV